MMPILPPIPVDEEQSSLSAILLDGGYYNVIHGEKIEIEGIPNFQDKINHFKSSVQESHIVPVLAAPYLSPERQTVCRESGVYFMDLSGNVFVAHQSFYVERIGFPNRFPEKRQRRYPFSDKASLILREMLKEPKAISIQMQKIYLPVFNSIVYMCEYD